MKIELTLSLASVTHKRSPLIYLIYLDLPKLSILDRSPINILDRSPCLEVLVQIVVYWVGVASRHYVRAAQA